MAKQQIRIDSDLEAFLHSTFKSVHSIYPSKTASKKKEEPTKGLSFFGIEEGHEKVVMTAPFVYAFQSGQEPKPCILILSSNQGVQCLPGRTCDLRQGIANGIVYQVGMEGDVFTTTFRRTLQQILSDGGASLFAEPDFSFLPKLVGAFPALSKEASLLEEARRVWKIEQLDDPTYLKSVDKGLKNVLDRLFAIGKDATDKKLIYQKGIDTLVNLQKGYKARLAALAGSAQLTKAQEFQYLAAILKSLQAGEFGLGQIKLNIEAYPALGDRLRKALVDYFSFLKHADERQVHVLLEDDQTALTGHQSKWVTLLA